METKVTVNGSSGRSAYVFVVAVVSVMLVVSAMVGAQRLKATVVQYGQASSETVASQPAASTGAGAGEYAFYTERYYEAAAARESAAAVEVDRDDFAYYSRHYYLTAAPQENGVTAATRDSIADFYARQYRVTAVPQEAGEDYAFYTGRYYEAAAARDAKDAAQSGEAEDYAFYTERYYKAAAAREAATAGGEVMR